MPSSYGILFDNATGGVLYELSSGGVLYGVEGVFALYRDNYYTRNQPAKSEELKNRVITKYAPLIAGDSEEVYRSSEPISLTGGASVVIEAEFNNVPCINVAASVDNLIGSTFTVTANYYSWGAVATVTNTGGSPGTCELVLDAEPLTAAQGENFESAKDAASIAENGVLEYKFPDNQLIQTAAGAAAVSESLVGSYATPRKDVAVVWRGNPALELGDEWRVPIYNRLPASPIMGTFYVFKNKINFDGTVKMETEGRKI